MKNITLVVWAIFIGILFISMFYVVTSGVTSYFIFPVSGNILEETEICKPVWVSVGLFSVDDVCLETCEKIHGVDKHKIESLKCFCDISNCNP